jgi:TolB-like protein
VWAPAVESNAPAHSTVPEKTIAVLPFVDMSEKKDQEYFGDGLSEELIDLLAKTKGVAGHCTNLVFLLQRQVGKDHDNRA